MKEYTYRYFKKAEKIELAEIYKEVFQAWMEAFRIKTNEDATSDKVRVKIASLLESAYKHEIKAVQLMESLNI